jgi:asparagine synthase (glutamine-hydrolysing)
MEGESRGAQIVLAIINKHFSLWRHLMNEENLAVIKRKLLRSLGFKEADCFSPSESVYLYEQWEWAERQSKYVVNGQRAYDFLGLSWKLPLWDDQYLFFWEQISPEHRFRQRLYRRYLETYDYCGLFKGFSPTLWRWPGLSLAIVPVARVGQILLGRNFKERVYKYAGYFGHYRPHFAAFGLGYYMKNIAKARNAVSFYVHTWLRENLTT